jgi:hypothetical protein
MATTMVRERPILFSGPMIEAILAGRKTQTRRVVKPQPGSGRSVWPCAYTGTGWALGEDPACVDPAGCSCTPITCPYGYVGQRLWVREKFRYTDFELLGSFASAAVEYADGYRSMRRKEGPASEIMSLKCGWRPSIHMPRWASRITLEITGVRVERLQSISEADKLAEGATPDMPFGTVWRKINTKPGIRWEDNPFCWVIEFRRVED